MGLWTLSPNTAPPPPSTVLSPLSADSHLTPGPALTLPAHRVRPCAHNHARGSLVGTHSGTHRPRHTRTGLRSGRGTAWYRCVHLQSHKPNKSHCLGSLLSLDSVNTSTYAWRRGNSCDLIVIFKTIRHSGIKSKLAAMLMMAR